MQEKIKRKMIRLYQYDYGVKVHFRQHLVSFLGYLLHLVHIVYMLRVYVYIYIYVKLCICYTTNNAVCDEYEL